MALLSQPEQAVARQWAVCLEAKAAADKAWLRVRRETRKLAKVAKLGRRKMIVVRISETRAVKIKNQFRGADECFAPAFAKKLAADEVKWDGDP